MKEFRSIFIFVSNLRSEFPKKLKISSQISWSAIKRFTNVIIFVKRTILHTSVRSDTNCYKHNVRKKISDYILLYFYSSSCDLFIVVYCRQQTSYFVHFVDSSCCYRFSFFFFPFFKLFLYYIL